MFHMGNSKEILQEISSVALLSPACFSYGPSIYCFIKARGGGDLSFSFLYAIYSRTKRQLFKSCPRVETLGMTSEGLEEMFEGDFAETCPNKYRLSLMGEQATP